MASPPIPVPIPSGLIPAPTPAPGSGQGGVGINWGGAETQFTQWVQSAGQFAMNQLRLAIGNGTTPGTDWFVTPIYSAMFGLGLVLLFIMSILGLFLSLRQSAPEILGKMIASAFAAFLISEGAVWVVTLLDNIADDMTNWGLEKLVGGNVTGLITHLGTVFAGAAAGNFFAGGAELIGVVLGGAILLAACLLALELLMRFVGIFLALAFLPIAAAGLATKATHVWLHRLIQLEIGLIMLKPAIILILGIGAAMLSANPLSSGPGGDPGWLAFMGGLVVIVMALFTPAALMKFVPWAEASLSSVLTTGAGSVAAVPLREGASQMSNAGLERFRKFTPGLKPRRAGNGANSLAAAAGSKGPVILQAANVIVRRVGQSPAVNGGKSPAPVHSGPAASVVRVIPSGSNGNGNGNKPPPPPRTPPPSSKAPPPPTAATSERKSK